MTQKSLKNYWNPGKWVLIWENSARAIQWIPTRQGLDGFQKSLCPYVLDESSLSIWRVNSPWSVLQYVGVWVGAAGSLGAQLTKNRTTPLATVPAEWQGVQRSSPLRNYQIITTWYKQGLDIPSWENSGDTKPKVTWWTMTRSRPEITRIVGG